MDELVARCPAIVVCAQVPCQDDGVPQGEVECKTQSWRAGNRATVLGLAEVARAQALKVLMDASVPRPDEDDEEDDDAG